MTAAPRRASQGAPSSPAGSIPSPEGDPQPGGMPASPCNPGRVAGHSSSQVHYAPNSAAPVQAGAAFSWGTKRRHLTEGQIDIIRRARAGELSISDACRMAQISESMFYRRAAELEMPSRWGSKTPQNQGRKFTPEEDALIRRCHDGEFKVDVVIRLLRTSPQSFYRRVRELGLHLRVKRACHAPDPLGDLPRPKDGWIPIAHSQDGRWREYEGTPVSIAIAQAAVAAGRATTAQVRIDGGFDLLLKVLAP